jgi:hypothetical protein
MPNDSSLLSWLDGWGEVHLVDRDDLMELPPLPGLYCLYALDVFCLFDREKFFKKNYLYIGESLDIRSRWVSGHHKWDAVEALMAIRADVYISYWAIPCEGDLDVLKDTLRSIESSLIKVRNPILNRTSPSRLSSSVLDFEVQGVLQRMQLET